MMTLEELLERFGDLAGPFGEAPSWLESASLEQVSELASWIGHWARLERERQQELALRAELIRDLQGRLTALAEVFSPDQKHRQEILRASAQASDLPTAALLSRIADFDQLARESRGVGLLIRQLEIVQSMLGTTPPEPAPEPLPPEPAPEPLPPEPAPEPPPPAPPPPADRARQIAERISNSLEAARLPPQTSDVRWAVDFGTARSKVALRDAAGRADEAYVSKLVSPSLIALQRDGDGIRFGHDAENLRFDAQQWAMVTSLKRLLIGQRHAVPGLHEWMNTERLAVLYLAWLLHTVDKEAPPGTSPLDTTTQLSLPLVEGAFEPRLWDLFDGATPTRRTDYKSWLPKACRLGQLVALTFRGEPWPTSQKELLNASMTWEQRPWSELRRTLATCSEPAAVMGDREPQELDPGLYLLVDCGAGTTDVSVFWNRVLRGRLVLTTVVERAAVVGGDTVDAEIVKAVMHKLGENGQDGSRYEHTVRAWAREAKLALLNGQSSTFDPAIELGLEEDLPFDLTPQHMGAGLERLRGQVQRAVGATLSAADQTLRECKPAGVRDWPDVRKLAGVYLVGGSAALKVVRQAVQASLEERQIQAVAVDLPKPGRYAAWADDRYRLSAVALGASRPSLEDPAPMPESLDRYGAIGNHHTDRDA